MRIQGLYAAVAATDMAASEAFYSRLFGRGPDDRPMDSLIQWRNVAGANVQVFLKPDDAGHGLMTIVTPDLDEAGAAVAGFGIALGEIVSGDFGRVAHVVDPAGNRLTLAEPPGRGGG